MSNTANTTQNTTNETNVTNETNSDITVFQDVLDNYRNADKGDKARIRANANKQALSALSGMDFTNAAIWANTANAMKADKPVIEVNHGQIAANAMFVLNAAIGAVTAYMVENGVTDIADIVPESDMSDLSAKGDKVASSLLSVKSDRRSIDDVFARAFAGQPVGTVMKVSAICAAGATADYTPGSGAVAARLRGDAPRTLTDDCTIANVVPVWVAADGTVAAEWSPSVNVGAQSV